MKSLILFFTLIPSLALGSLTFGPSVSTFKADDDQSMTQLEMRLGYEFDFGLYVGGFYSLASDKFIDHTDHYFLGPMIGYEYKGLYVLAAYILTGEHDLASGGKKYSGTSGYQGSVGYRLPISENVFLGPELTFRTVEFDTLETQGIATPVNRKDTHVLPSFTFYFKF